MSSFTLHRNTNGESYNDLINKTLESEVELKKKKGRLRQKGESGNKEWEDDKIVALIDTWSGIE